MKKSKILSIALASLMSFSTLTACGGNENGGGGTQVKKGTTALRVAYFAAGYGVEWLEALKTRFETAYADYSFEEGKRGVTVVPVPYSESGAADMKTKTYEVRVEEKYGTQDFYGQGFVEDITAAVTTSLGVSYGVDAEGTALPALANETKSIYEKMSDVEKSYYVLGEGEEKEIFGVPYISPLDAGLNYDPSMFETHGLYYKADNTLGGKKSTGEALGTGPDGVSGNADDGLPRTYAEFFAVCKKLKEECQTTPFVWAGNYNNYVTQLAVGLAMNNLGADVVKSLMAGEGTIPDYVTSLTENGVATTEQKAFTADTFDSVIYNSESLYRALEFVDTIVANSYANPDNSYTTSYTHEMAQGDFILGKRLPKNQGKDFGFLVDGSWWSIEAEKYWKQYEQRYGNRNERPLQVMPMPKATEEAFERTKGQITYASSYCTGILVRDGLAASKKTLAETFVRFMCTDESLYEYTKIQSQPRALTYSLNNEQYNSLSAQGKAVYGILNKTNGYETSEYVMLQTNNAFFVENQTKITQLFKASSPRFGALQNIVQGFYDHRADGLTPKVWFDALSGKTN